MNIRMRLIAGFAVLLVSIGVLSVITAGSVADATAANERMEHSRAQLDASVDLSQQLDAYLTTGLTELMSPTPDPSKLTVDQTPLGESLELAKDVRENEQELEEESGLEEDEDEDALLEEIEESVEEIETSFLAAARLELSGDAETGQALAVDVASSDAVQTLRESIDDGIEDERSEFKEAEQVYAAASQRVADTTRIVSLLTFAIAIGLLLWTVPPLTRSLNAMHAGVEQVSKGDLSSPIEITGQHELARFSKAFNGMLEDLQEAKLRQATEAEARAASRRAGMADVATGVLHNVGNVLNSLRVSVEVIREDLRPGSLEKLNKTVALLEEHGDDVASFLAEDPRGHLVIPFLAEIAQDLETQRFGLDNEAKEMQTRLAHIEMIIGKQQQHSRRASLLEWVQVSEIVEDATTILMPSFERHGVTLAVDLTEAPHARLDRHQVLEMLINLLSNAKDAVVASGKPDRCVSIAVRTIGDEQIAVDVTDNGVGIGTDDIEKVFTYGYTTKDDGHGFGLHNAANAAKATGGDIVAHSNGEGSGSTFSLVLPVNPPSKTEEKPEAKAMAYAGNGSSA